MPLMAARPQHAVPVVCEKYKTYKCQQFKGLKIRSRYVSSLKEHIGDEIRAERVHVDTIFLEKGIIKKGFYF